MKMNNKMKIMMCAFIALQFMLIPNVAYAVNYGENLANVTLDQLSYVVFAVAGFGALMAFFRRSLTGAITMIVGGGLIWFFLKYPDVIGRMGETIARSILG